MSKFKVRIVQASPAEQFSESFRRQVVAEYEKGPLNKDQLMRKYGIKGKSVVLNWCRKYGKLSYSDPSPGGRPMKDPQKQRIKELEQKLREAEQKLLVYDKLVEVANRELKLDLVKNFEARLSGNWQQEEKKED